MRIACIAIVSALPLMAANILTVRAKELLRLPAGHAEAVKLLEQVTAQDPNDAEALTLLGLVRMTRKDITPEELRTDVEPLFQRALDVERRDPNANRSDFALALEAEAGVLNRLDRAGEAQVLSAQASGLRREIVRSLADAPSTTSAPFRVGGGTSAPSVISKTDPEYTEEARLQKISGTVLVSVLVDVDGMARDIQLVKSAGFGLDEKAVETVRSWRFKPAARDGQPVVVKAQIEVNFRLL